MTRSDAIKVEIEIYQAIKADAEKILVKLEDQLRKETESEILLRHGVQ